MENALELIFATARPPGEILTELPEENMVKAKLARTEEALEKARRTSREDFIPIEATAMMQQVREARKRLEAEKRNLEFWISSMETDKKTALEKHRMHVHVARNGFVQQLDTAPLATTKYSGPLFMVSPYFNHNGRVSISMDIDNANRKYRIAVKPNVPDAIQALIQQACAELSSRYQTKYQKLVISGAFRGWADHETSRIKRMVSLALRRKVFDDILVIAEAPEWEVDQLVPQKNLDPIIGGWVKKTSQLFFITAYNMSPVEKYFVEQAGFGVSY